MASRRILRDLFWSQKVLSHKTKRAKFHVKHKSNYFSKTEIQSLKEMLDSEDMESILLALRIIREHPTYRHYKRNKLLFKFHKYENLTTMTLEDVMSNCLGNIKISGLTADSTKWVLLVYEWMLTHSNL